MRAFLRLPRRARARRGQATLESMMMMGFLLLFVFGLMHLVMFAVTRYMVQYAAFAAVRADVVGNSPQLAAEAVMANLNWYADEGGEMPVTVEWGIKGFTTGYYVRTRVPFGLPIYEYLEPEGLEIVAFAPTNTQSDRPSGGDND
ncbi:TadE family protein [Luteitalea sp.]|uniref:TadE family protein n=1 Tax=Luteitalea sp. TaxID=2004800 RepID=UPI0037CC2817